MLGIKEIEKYYPESQKIFKRNILREYLQYKILQIIFNHETSKKLSFMGGTCLRVVYGTGRFSEDLDFDNFGLKISDFEELSGVVKRELQLEGYEVEIKNVYKGAYRCYIRIPKLLFNNELSGYEEEKILIQIDTESQGFNYVRENYLLNKFDVFTSIFITPANILLSQKIWAILNRKVMKGRDLYDASFLFGVTSPDYNYLKLKAGIEKKEKLVEVLLRRIENENLDTLAKDVEPFLINPGESIRITAFDETLKKLL
jgi:predicted nucleotidyltransferase component of viral defense system